MSYGDPARLAEFALPVVPDTVPGHAGPLAGVLAGMDWAGAHRPAIPLLLTVAADTPFLPLDLPWQVIGGQMQFPFSGEDPRIADARAGIFFSIGGLTAAEVAAEDTPLTRAFLAAHRRMRELGHEMDVGSGA